MKKLLLFFGMCGQLMVMGQKIPDPKSFAASITEADLKKHLYTIAGRDFEGRETATEGQRKAAAYIERFFKSIGLQPGNKDGYQLNYPVFRDSLLAAGLSVNGRAFNLNEDFAINLNTDHSSTTYNGEVVFAGYGISDSLRDDYKGLDVKGKVVLLLNGQPADYKPVKQRRGSQSIKQQMALKNGAIAVLVIQTNFTGDNTRNGNMYVEAYKKTILPNIFYVSEKITQAIMGDDYLAAKSGNIQAKTYNSNIMLKVEKESEQLQSSDVLGWLEGTDLKDQLLVISAHYDHLGKRDTVIYYGADDDGSGTVSILELAEAFSKAKAAGKGPRRSILFLANSGEEEGLWGSEFYSSHPAYPLENTTADLNIDMVGRIDPQRKKTDSMNYVYVIGDDKLSSDLHLISTEMNNKYVKMDLDYKFNDPNDPERIYYRSDHYNFAKKGVPIIFYFDGIHNDYHRPTDTPDKINYDLMAKRVKLVFFTAWEMANRQDMLKRDIPLN